MAILNLKGPYSDGAQTCKMNNFLFYTSHLYQVNRFVCVDFRLSTCVLSKNNNHCLVWSNRVVLDNILCQCLLLTLEVNLGYPLPGHMDLFCLLQVKDQGILLYIQWSVYGCVQ